MVKRSPANAGGAGLIPGGGVKIPTGILPHPTKETEQKKQTIKNSVNGTSLVVQWLRFPTFIARGMGLIPDGGTNIPHAAGCSQKKLLSRMETDQNSGG